MGMLKRIGAAQSSTFCQGLEKLIGDEGAIEESVFPGVVVFTCDCLTSVSVVECLSYETGVKGTA